jgi:FO synthase
MNLQVPPNLNASDYGVFLAAGINDWGGISPVTCDHVNPTSPWPEIAELRRVTEEHGFELRARLPIYPEYLGRSEFVPSRLRPHIRSLVDRQGFVKDAA